MNDDATWQRLESQIEWYDDRSKYNQRLFKILKILQVGAAATIPVVAAATFPSYVTGGLGGLILLLEGVQHLNQYQQNWIAYRSTAESLKHEKYLFLATAGPYSSSENPRALLAERVEGLVSQEHAKWISTREEAAKRDKHGR